MQPTSFLAVSRPDHEAALYHAPGRNGFFTLGWSTKSGRTTAAEAMACLKCIPEVERSQHGSTDLAAGYRQRSFPLAEMPEILRNIEQHVPLLHADRWETTSIWISQGEFTRPNRQKINLARIAVCWVDLDLRHETSPAALKSLSKDRALAKALAKCNSLEIPLPSFVLWTGRGLVLKWLIDVLPKSGYPRWSAVQRMLVEAFVDLGGDASARDASRILRIPGTYNPKSGDLCEPIYINQFWGEVVRHSFDDLANAVLPFTREQIASLRQERALARQQRARRLKQHLHVIESEHTGKGNLRAFNPVRLAWLQVDDYRALAAMRPVETRPEGWTNTIVWMAASALAVAIWADADMFDREFIALASELAPHWPASRVLQAVSSVRSRMQLMARGEWVEHNGKTRPPVYTPKHSTVLRELGVTDAEAEQLSVIIPRELAEERARERDRKRDEERRRDAGKQPRNDYLEKAQTRRQAVFEMRAEGIPAIQIANTLGIARESVYRMLRKG